MVELAFRPASKPSGLFFSRLSRRHSPPCHLAHATSVRHSHLMKLSSWAEACRLCTPESRDLRFAAGEDQSLPRRTAGPSTRAEALGRDDNSLGKSDGDIGNTDSLRSGSPSVDALEPRGLASKLAILRSHS